PGEVRAAGAGVLPAEATVARGVDIQRPKRRHRRKGSGHESRIFSQRPTKAQPKHHNATDRNRAHRRAPHVNRKRSKSLRRGFTSEICHSMRRRATCLISSTVLATCKTPKW